MTDVASAPASPRGRGAWIKSSYSTGNCTCLEARVAGDHVDIRDSKDPRCTVAPGEESIISVSIPAWTEFLAELSDAPWAATTKALKIVADDRHVAMCCNTTRTTLLFNRAEWGAFLEGTSAGEFTVSPSHPN